MKVQAFDDLAKDATGERPVFVLQQYGLIEGWYAFLAAAIIKVEGEQEKQGIDNWFILSRDTTLIHDSRHRLNRRRRRWARLISRNGHHNSPTSSSRHSHTTPPPMPSHTASPTSLPPLPSLLPPPRSSTPRCRSCLPPCHAPSSRKHRHCNLCITTCTRASPPRTIFWIR